MSTSLFLLCLATGALGFIALALLFLIALLRLLAHEERQEARDELAALEAQFSLPARERLRR